MEELNKFRQFLTEGKKKTIKEASFGNDPESRYEYIRPLMSKLPDSARTEALIDGMEEALAEDDKMEFDFYFVEAMKMLGLEDKLMEPDDMMSEPDYEDYAPDSALGPNPSFVEEAEGEKTDYMKRRKKMSDYYVNPEAEEIEDEDLEAAADYFDSLAENDKVLDGVIKEGTWALGNFKQIEDVIRSLQGVLRMADNAESKRGVAGKIAVRDFQHQLKDEQWTGRLYRILGDDEFWDAYGSAQAAAEVLDFDRAKNYLGDAIARAEKLKATMSPEQKANVFVRENKALKASNDLEKTLNSVVDELTDDQIDSITNMILDLRDKVKAKKK